MKQKMIVTNLRIPEPDWLQVKAIAAEQGVSANEYINDLIRMAPIQIPSRMRKKRAQKMSIYDALIKISKMPNNPIPGDELSEEDKIIYET